MKVLIVYGTTEGQTRKICEQIGTWMRDAGAQVDLIDSTIVPDEMNLQIYDAFIAAGSLHQAKHQASLAHFIQAHEAGLKGLPSAFLSVSLTAISKDEKHRADAQKCIDQFIEQTGWHPTITKPVAGALKYTQYDWLRRMVMRSIVKKEGGDIDTSRDYEYTDWEDLKVFTSEFLSAMAPKQEAALIG